MESEGFEKKIHIPKPVMVDPKILKLHPKNVKKHDEKQLHDLGVLYEMIGFTDPIIADKDNVVWAGNGSLQSALKKNMPLVPVVYMPDQWTDEQKKIFMLMDNKITESPWNFDNFKPIFDAVSPTLTGLFQADFTDLLQKFALPEDWEEPKAEKIPEPPENPTSKLGDVYQLGPHLLMCGDALLHLEEFLHGIEPAALITDPPYGMGGYAGRSGKFEGVKNDDVDVAKFYNALPKDIPERYIWGNWFNIKSIEEKPRDVIVWKKNNFGMGKGYRNQYEICMYFGKFAGSDSDVWEVKKDYVTGYKHPTQKPVKLALRALKNSTKVNDTVLDCYAGSGSTLIACEQSKRICYAMEIEPKYVDLIKTRWENYTNKTSKKLTNLLTN